MIIKCNTFINVNVFAYIKKTDDNFANRVNI